MCPFDELRGDPQRLQSRQKVFLARRKECKGGPASASSGGDAKRRQARPAVALALQLGMGSALRLAWVLALCARACASAPPGARLSCAMRGSCVPSRVCACAPGADGCEAGGAACPFPGSGAPCVLPADDNAPLPASALAPSIERVCPGVLGADGLACCDEAQLAFLQQQLDMARGLLANCPACWANFQRFWCVFTCSPDQGSFVDVTKSRICDASLFPGQNSAHGAEAGCEGTNSSAQNIPTVQAVRLRVDEAYAAGIFRSCKDVTVSATGQKAVDMAFGGARSAADFLNFQGVTAYSSGQNPLKLEFDFLNSSTITSVTQSAGDASDSSSGGKVTAGRGNTVAPAGAMREATVECHVEDAELGCLCNDCASACPAAPPLHNASPWYRVSLDPLIHLDVNALFAAAVLVLGLLFAQALLEALETSASGLPGFSCFLGDFEQQAQQRDDVREPSADARAAVSVVCGQPAHDCAAPVGDGSLGVQGASGRRWLEGALGSAAGRCAMQPRRVMRVWGAIAGASVVCLIASPMHVLTDPVKLWAQPGR